MWSVVPQWKMVTLQICVYKGFESLQLLSLGFEPIPLIYHDIVLQYKLSTCMTCIWVFSTIVNTNYFIIFEQIHLTKKKHTHTQRPIQLKHFEFENKTSDIILLNSWGQYEYEFKKTLLGFMTSCLSLMFWVICPKSSHGDFLALYTRSI